MKKLWLLWISLTIGIAIYYGLTMFVSEDKSELLIGDTSHGHYQIEMACTACHQEAFGGDEILQNSCVGCHQQELDDAHDSHPKKKFTDPRNADRLEVVDARYCVSCHTEHKEEQIDNMGVSLPSDYCYHCHKDVGEDRESHQGLAFDSCASSGCHNYHDNKALYESFLVEHADEPWLKDMHEIITQSKAANFAAVTNEDKSWGAKSSISIEETALNEEYRYKNEEISHQFDQDAHSNAGIECSSCHTDESLDNTWIEKPTIEACSSCHEKEVAGFKQSKHGMRLVQGLAVVNTEIAQQTAQTRDGLAFHEMANPQEQGCNACHAPHDYSEESAERAVTDSCLSCHSDEHSSNFKNSKHAGLEEQLKGQVSVSCATCHMPHVKEKVNGQEVIRVEHNQSLNLRPNEKMIRSVCMDCHSLEFSIDALADELLIKSNFTGQPSKHIPSIDWAKERSK